METGSQPNVTLAQIAAEAKLSATAVSYALRGHPKISAATRERVLAAARKLGYRPNPRISSLMSHIRQGRRQAVHDQIAFVWVHTTPEESRNSPYLQRIWQGARRRAEQLGFAMEEFWTSAPGMTDRRLQEIMHARGIIGVVFSPVLKSEHSVCLDWQWEDVAAAVIGNTHWTPELHHSGHHHYLGMCLALDALKARGCERPAALLLRVDNDRAKRAAEGAFLTQHPSPALAPGLIQALDRAAFPSVPAWLRASGADALIVGQTNFLDAPGIRQTCRDLRLTVATLHWNGLAEDLVGGIDQGEDRIASHAVDLVASQLHGNESGAPDTPARMLFPGRWVDAG